MSGWGPLIYAGCFAATLSSAISMLVGAPRIFQAVSKDKLFPGHYNVQLIYMKNHNNIVQVIFKEKKFNLNFPLLSSGLEFFGVGYGVNNEPIRAYCVVFVISLTCILIGDLNQVRFTQVMPNYVIQMSPKMLDCF
jgi:solute carrier family 12 sodium/potassium/chloride transporter 2